ncbi:hypothetical protein Ciccas_003181 [Cichlidogyrus casuarinus]|uniref:Liprin-alpha CC2 domain-containing protein n=1 Tax=Cichlidogyrus casuarinus TaxID=1844966 RepID=A0ABD2QF49_9PLAT
MCDVMPTIVEEASSCLGENDSQASGEPNGVEDMLISILTERDRLMENLQEAQSQLMQTNNKLSEIERERDSLNCQLSVKFPEDVSLLTKELHQLREQILEHEEEVRDLKAERNNSRLLLEHLECLVARHERSLRTTVIKRQQSNVALNSSGGVSSEVEVLKALKSLFEHHKALEEKVRERVRGMGERIAQLETELQQALEEKQTIRDELADTLDNMLAKNDFSENSSAYVAAKFAQNCAATEKRLQESLAKIRELSTIVNQNVRENNRNKSQLERFQRDLYESENQREDLEQRFTTLEQRYLSSQRESTNVLDNLSRVQAELITRRTELKQSEDQRTHLKTELEMLKKQNSELQTQLVSKHGPEDLVDSTTGKHGDHLSASRQSADTTTNGFENDADETTNSSSDSIPVSNLSESGLPVSLTNGEKNLKQHLNRAEERIRELQTSLQHTQAELQRYSQRERLNEEHSARLNATVDKLLLESNERLQTHLREKMSALEERNQLNAELDRVRNLLESTQNEKDNLLDELDRTRHEINDCRVKDYETLQRMRSPFKATSPYSENLAKIADVPVTQASSNNSADAQTLALLIQDQLDAINNEIKLIQEEKHSAEQLAEEIESRTGAYSCVSPVPVTYSPPVSPFTGRSSPLMNQVPLPAPRNVMVYSHYASPPPATPYAHLSGQFRSHSALGMPFQQMVRKNYGVIK